MLIPSQLEQKLKNTDAFLVGGAVRDFLLKKENIKDLDFVVFGLNDLANFIQNIATQTESAFVKLDEENGIYRVVNADWQADFTLPRGFSIAEDLHARDLSINAIGFNLSDKTLIDPLDGQKDLQDKKIKIISEDNLKADYLRAVRVFRFAAQLDFQIEASSLELVKNNLNLISGIAPERVSAELWFLLTSENSFKYLLAMFESGLWEKIFPEFTPLRQVPPNDFHHLPLWEHTFELVKQYESEVKQKLPNYALEFIHSEKINGISLEAVLKMGCLFHDLGKPATWKIIQGKHTFYGHDALGAEITENIGKRLMWPRAVTSSICELVKHHLRPFNIAALEAEPTEKAERRFFRQLGNNFYPLIALAWADLLSTRGRCVTEQTIAQSEERLKKLCEKFYEFSHQEKSEPLLLKGDKLVEAIGLAKLPPTKAIKDMLAELRDKQLAGELKTEEEAFAWFVKEGNSKKN